MIDRTGIDREAVGRQWQERGFSCDLWVDPPGQAWSGFRHDVDALVLVLEGSLQIEMGERTIRLEPGDELMIPATCRHTVRNVSEETSRWLCGYRSDVSRV